MNIKRSLQSLTKLEWSLWIASLLVIGLSFFMEDISILNIIGSLIGVTALIFISKGNVIGQFLIVIFSIIYGIISIAFGYYGEMITYMFMTAPTAIFYFILKYLNTENLIISTISITTSFIAGYLTYLRSPYYSLGYSANDIVLIILWLYATFINITYFPMVLCFVMFLFNDLYGLYNWQKMLKRQNQNK